MLVIAKATDENLTSENWEYILVLATATHPTHALGLSQNRMSATECPLKRLGTIYETVLAYAFSETDVCRK